MSTLPRLMMLASGKSYHATRWANALAGRGLDVAFVTVNKVVRPLDERISATDLSSFGKIDYLTSWRHVRRLLKSYAPDVVHSHSAGGYAAMGRLAGFQPWIVSVYGADVYEVPNRSSLHRAVVGNMLRRADLVLSTSHAMARQVQSVFPDLPHPLVTPFGVDLSHFTRRRISGNVQGARRIGIVKKLEPKYGIDILIAAFEILSRRIDEPLELHIVGEGSKRAELERQALVTECAERIVFHGSIPNLEVPQFLEQIDIFVVPSREESESFGVAAVEAMAMSLPVIVSNVGGLPEVVEHDKSGLVVPREDPVALAEAMHRLISDGSERAAFGASARRKVEREYDWDANVSDMIRIYEMVLDRTGR